MGMIPNKRQKRACDNQGLKKYDIDRAGYEDVIESTSRKGCTTDINALISIKINHIQKDCMAVFH